MSFHEGSLILHRDGVLTPVFSNYHTFTNMLAARSAGTLPRNFIFPSTDPGCGCGTDYELAGDPPWANASYGPADDFLGFWVWEASGFDGRHNARPTTPRVSFPAGSMLGPLQPTHRTLTFEVAAIATSQRGLQYGMDWLESLFMRTCSTCAFDSLIYYTSCPIPDVDSVSDLVVPAWELFECGLADGPEWTDWLTDQTRPYARNFTISFYAGNPCRISYDSTVVEAGAALDVTAPIVPSCWQILDDTGGLFEIVPTITLTRAAGGASPAILVAVYANPSGSPCAGSPTYDSLAYLLINSIPASTGIEIDFGRRRITYASGGSGVGEDASELLDISGGYIDWGAIGCADELYVYIAAQAAGNSVTAAITRKYRAGC